MIQLQYNLLKLFNFTKSALKIPTVPVPGMVINEHGCLAVRPSVTTMIFCSHRQADSGCLAFCEMPDQMAMYPEVARARIPDRWVLDKIKCCPTFIDVFNSL